MHAIESKIGLFKQKMHTWRCMGMHAYISSKRISWKKKKGKRKKEREKKKKR